MLRIFSSKKGQNLPNLPIIFISFFLVFIIDGIFANFADPGIRFFLFIIYIAIIAIYSYTTNSIHEVFIPNLIAALVMFFIPVILRLLSINPTRTAIVIIIGYFIWLTIIVTQMPPNGIPPSLLTIVRFAVYLILILIILVLMRSFMPPDYVRAVAQESLGVDIDVVQINLWDALKLNVNLLWKGTTDLFKSGWKVTKKEILKGMEFYGGDFYTAKVDKSKNGPRGVFLSKVESSSESFYSDQDITVWATLQSQTDQGSKDTNFNINASCYTDNQKSSIKNNKYDGHINGDNFIFSQPLFGNDIIDLNCKFPKNELEEGTHTVTFSVDFDYETFSYVRVYFISEEKQRELLRQNIDPYTEYKIMEKTPITEYSGGPISIGMGAGTASIIALPKENVPKIKFGLTLDDIWEGDIKQIDEIIIKIPNGLNLEQCDYDFAQVTPCGKYCAEDEKYEKAYVLDYDHILNIQDKLKSRTVHTFSCFLKPAVSTEDFMAGAIIKSNYIKSTIRYKYNIEASKMIKVEETVSECNAENEGKQCSTIGEICIQENTDKYGCISKCEYLAKKNGQFNSDPVAAKLTKENNALTKIDNTWVCTQCGYDQCRTEFSKGRCIYGLCATAGDQCCAQDDGFIEQRVAQ